MQAGQLSERISIQAPTRVTDEFGDWTSTTYNEIRNCWANVKLKTAAETYGNDQWTQVYAYMFTVRYFSHDDFNETCIVVWDNRTYEIKTIDRQIQWDEVRIYAKLVD